MSKRAIKFKFRLDEGDFLIEASNIALFLEIGEFYSIDAESGIIVFSILKFRDIDTLEIKVDTDNTKGSINTNEIFTELHRGFDLSASTVGNYDTHFHRNGYMGISNSVKQLFLNKIDNWGWNNLGLFRTWEQRKVNDAKWVPLEFFNKRPVFRKELVELEKDKAKITYPYMTFTPLGHTNLTEEWPLIEDWTSSMDNLLVKQEDDEGVAIFRDIEEFKAPVVKEFGYQITAITVGFPDLELIRTHLENQIFPLDHLERFATFPSGFNYRVRQEPTVINPLTDSGIFECSIDYYFLIPIVEHYPEYTFKAINGEIVISD
ncbi:hypothetical protein M1M30_gp080 [Maribacter phage Colly_1]|uniref:Uncharacterized protein n=1 Tax=Maribacter phage Colly_1 TaxID=2745691 RepID=A0A8E4XVC2_9CAUD|nr:hypothetical protein M1M30_gp080 [Maribacter phage Colly_1]QQO97367.1 hypothetical protein Colly1_80 [Maribacter phage Colly_1]